MGEIVDLHTERAKRQAEKDRSVAKLALPRPVEVIDTDWDNDPPGYYIDGVFFPYEPGSEDL